MKNHKYFKELITLAFLDEISDTERALLDTHLEGCAECREEFSSYKVLNEALRNRPEFAPGEELVQNFNMKVMAQIRRKKELNLRGLFSSLSERFWTLYESIVMRPGFVLGGVFGVLLLGILIGKLWLSSDILHDPELLLEFAQEQRKLTQMEREDLQKIVANYLIQEGNLEVEKLKLVNKEESKVAVDFVTSSDFQVSGDVNDTPIQNVVLYTLKNDENPGVRLRAIRMLENVKKNPRVRITLNSVLLEDSNDGVRLRAAQILRKMPGDSGTVRAFMKALASDPNPRVRIEIIEAFKEWKDVSVKSVLALAASQDENSYIRREAQALLEQLNRNDRNGS